MITLNVLRLQSNDVDDFVIQAFLIIVVKLDLKSLENNRLQVL